MNEVLESAEILPVGVLQQPGDNRFIAFVKSMFQVMQPDQQAGRFGRAPLLGIERTELFVKDRPVDLIGQQIQRMPPIENLVKTRPEEILVVTLLGLFGLHKITRN
jgi:hypothetical protein